MRGGVASVAVFGAYVWAVTRWPGPGIAPFAALPVIACFMTVAYLRTAFTKIVIDTARITCRQGILNRRVEIHGTAWAKSLTGSRRPSEPASILPSSGWGSRANK